MFITFLQERRALNIVKWSHDKINFTVMKKGGNSY